jgi:hypothetical protein
VPLIIEKWAATNNTVAAHFLFTLPPARKAPAAPLTPRPITFHNRPVKARSQKDKRHPTRNRVPHFVMQSFPE